MIVILTCITIYVCMSVLKVGQEIMLQFIIQKHFDHDPKVKLEDLTLSNK